jgi:hypothetical protein
VAVLSSDSADRDVALQHAGVAMRHARDAGPTADRSQF